MVKSVPPPESSQRAIREGLAGRLLAANTPEDVAEILYDTTPGLRSNGGCVLWSDRWPEDIHCYPPEHCSEELIAEAARAVATLSVGSAGASGTILHHDGDRALVFLHCPQGGIEPVSPEAKARMVEVLAAQWMHEAVARLQQSEKLQRSLYAIADMVSSDLDMPEMLRGVHRIIADLMYAENFYIALYDRDRDSLRLPYVVDTVDTLGPSLGEEIPMSALEHGLTWYLIHEGRPLMGTTEQLAAQVPGPLVIHGADSADWLGVPMLRDGRVIGAIVVQSYLEERQYTSAESHLLTFVAEHVQTALERKTSQEELERRVEARTAELEATNVELRREILERERGERLQSALYRIAELATTDTSTDEFYRHVHEIVGELINAQNFYIALLSEDGATVTFPYAVDEQERDFSPRSSARGLTEYVMRTGQPVLVDVPMVHALRDSGEIEPGMLIGATLLWLGAPLFGPDRVVGVIAMQTYSPQVHYDERDLELLRFVSSQISSSLQRRDAAERLLQINAQLERRVEERTRELRAEIGVREEVEAQLKHQVMHDPLTGLPNRIYMRDRIERALATVHRDPDCTFGLLYIDIDRFKLVNDSLGHLAGDVVLQEVARRLANAVRQPDVVARLAGDEFAILLEHVRIPETATKVAQRIIASLEAPIDVSGQSIQVGASIGLAIGDARYAGADEVVRDADAALYRAKTSGRNRLVLFDENLHQAAMSGLALEQELRHALAHREFLPYYQPLVRLEDGHVYGYEALIRWNHPTRGILAPGAFLEAAEDSGLIEPIDWRMFLDAMREATSFIGDAILTINVSPRMFQYADLDRRLLAVTDAAGFDPSQLCIEVTEGTLLADPAVVAAILGRLRAAGIIAALDDFGTGHSSLGHIHLFPLKTIKIDRSFVAAISTDDSGRSSAIIGAILALARTLGLDVVAEGVETEHQRRVLLDMGCVFGQGYLFSRPQPASHWIAT
jgi:diguanylate cyclase (GGDEF)-like protein